MKLLATFTAAFADRIRNARVQRSDSDMPYAVVVSSEQPYSTRTTKYTYDLPEALKAARSWMDTITEEESRGDGTEAGRAEAPAGPGGAQEDHP